MSRSNPHTESLNHLNHLRRKSLPCKDRPEVVQATVVTESLDPLNHFGTWSTGSPDWFRNRKLNHFGPPIARQGFTSQLVQVVQVSRVHRRGTVKAIETKYKGYRFRSRLEARWAVFLDTLGVAWEYERQGYSLPSGTYLPDFWLPGLSAWLEIKGANPTNEERRLASDLAEHTGSSVYLFSGSVPGFNVEQTAGYESESGEVFQEQHGPSEGRCGWDNYQAFCVCETCGDVGIQFEGRSDRLNCKQCYRCNDARNGIDVSTYLTRCPRPGGCHGRCPRSHHGDKGRTFNHKRILEAVNEARGARFEHGESPRPVFNPMPNVDSWLIAQFRTKLEWESSELIEAAARSGIQPSQLFEAKRRLNLPKAWLRTKENGDQVWIWWAAYDWPALVNKTP